MDAADLAFSGLARQAQLVAGGEASSRELVELYLERIARLDPQLNAFRTVLAESARAAAAAADARIAAGERAPLLGVPVAIKDDADVAGEITAWGTAANGGPKAADSEVVGRLRQAGAIVIGKTNVPELTISLFTESLSYGATRNPWDTSRTPGGSSGGSGAAVAAGLVGGALGSDGTGSIRIPSSWCGLFGLKPSRGRVSGAPNDRGWFGLSVFGPMARTVADAALFLDVTAQSAPERPFAEAATTTPGRLRIAMSAKTPPGTQLVPMLDAEHRRAFEDSGALLRSLGHEVVEHDPKFPPALVPGVIACYMRGIHDDAAGLPHPERLEKRTKGFARLGAAWRPGVVARLAARQDAVRAQIEASLRGFDVLLTPSTATPPPEVGRWQDRGALLTLNTMAPLVPWYGTYNYTGQPAASVPAGLSSRGLPLAVQLVGRMDDEATLLSLAAQIEAERPWAQHRPPVS